MFVHREKLHHLLSPHHYRDAEFAAVEREKVFRPSWHFVCAASELPRSGDFQTMMVVDRPIIVRNFDGDIRAFENVCPHRHSMLSCEAAGHSREFKCQYHGWQFKKDGTTAKIPEPKAFRPWDRENARLDCIRLERCGDLLFATLDQRAPPLSEWMGGQADAIEAGFTRPMWRMGEAWEFDAPCNWKVVIENTLESYHIGEVHPTWMNGLLPREEDSIHELEPERTRLRYWAGSSLERSAVFWCRRLGGQPTRGYIHYHFHPNLIVVLTDLFNYVATTVPTGPSTCRVRTRMYPLAGSKRGPVNYWAAKIAWWYSRHLMKKIFNEDRTVYAGQQRGIQSSRHRGVIGIREERIFQFQKWMCERTGVQPQALPGESPKSETLTLAVGRAS